MPKTKKKNRTLTKPEGDGYCRKCQSIFNLSNFYEAANPAIDTNGRMSICKDCCNLVYENYFGIYGTIEAAMKATCQDLDVIFNYEALKQTQSHAEGIVSRGKNLTKIFGIYKSKIGSTGKHNAGLEDFRYKNSDHFQKEATVVPVKHQDTLDSIELEMLRIKWGADLPIDDLVWLEQKFEDWHDSYDISGKSMEMLVEQLCFEELFTYKERQQGKDVTKRLTNIQNMLKNSKLSPRQETASEQAEFSTISEFIRKVEQSKPIIKSNPEFEDPDNFKNMWQAMVGALSRTAGKPDEYTQVFDEYFADSTVDLTNLTSKD